jgi:hypothetical protein
MMSSIFCLLIGGPNRFWRDTCFLLLKSIYETLQAARKWHTHISTSGWMESNGYEAMNSEKTIFMKCKGAKYIIHGLFVDDMMHI